jgi:hypothetical protein
MVSDGDCTRRSAKRIASFHRFGLVTQIGFAGQSPLKNAAYPYHNAYAPTRFQLASFARMAGHRVMASDGDCARRSAKRIASFHRFGLVTQVGFAGQSSLKNTFSWSS